jgi:hypothetical protein
MSSEINESVTNDNYDDFQHVNLIFSQNFILLFWGLFNDEADLRVRVKPNLMGLRVPKESEDNKVIQ